MPEAALAEHLAADRSVAVRGLLASPLLDADADPDAFRSVVRHAGWLIDYFEQTCGWSLVVDPAAGFARLAKRTATEPDVSRPLRRTRGDHAPFDRRRYGLLCLACAELVRHPVTTVGLLATAVTAEAGLDTSRYGERAAFTDALRVLVSWGALRVTAGEVDAFLDSERANAILTADTARLHRLLVSPASPSTLPETIDVDGAIERLLAEPRYGDTGPDAGEDLSDEGRNRWARHRLGRLLLDDPAVHLDDLDGIERDYLASISGRRFLRERVADAGMDLEERAEGLLAIDPDGLATDRRFPAPLGNAHQVALLLVDQLVTTDVEGHRRLHHLTPEHLLAAVNAVLARHPGWARAHRDDDGPARLAAEGVALLASFGLVRVEADGSIVARPSLARYRVGEPITHGARTLFDPDEAETT